MRQRQQKRKWDLGFGRTEKQIRLVSEQVEGRRWGTAKLEKVLHEGNNFKFIDTGKKTKGWYPEILTAVESEFFQL
jgi:hypothetical protein